MDKSSKKVFIITLILTFVLGWIAQGFAILAKYKWPTAPAGGRLWRVHDFGAGTNRNYFYDSHAYYSFVAVL